MPLRDPEARRAYQAAWYIANHERITAQQLAYSAEHRAEAVRRVAAWRLANPGRRAANHRAYVAAHPEEARVKRAARTAALAAANPGAATARSQAWKAAHPDRARENANKGKAVARGAAPCAHPACLTVGAATLAWQTNPHACYLCGAELQSIRWIDHVMPISRGGLHCADNLRPACARCNHRKRAKMLAEYVVALG